MSLCNSLERGMDTPPGAPTEFEMRIRRCTIVEQRASPGVVADPALARDHHHPWAQSACCCEG
eukprot:13618696-Alexandrium_andersonii.AAC.1